MCPPIEGHNEDADSTGLSLPTKGFLIDLQAIHPAHRLVAGGHAVRPYDDSTASGNRLPQKLCCLSLVKPLSRSPTRCAMR